MRTDERISMLVCSCDLYEDVWEPYFRLIHKNWPEHPEKCFLMTEEKKYNCGFMNVKTVCSGKEKVWSKRLQQALDIIDSEYVLFSLEDYFVHGKVNQEAFVDAVKQMDAHPKWGGVWFHPIRKGVVYPDEYEREVAYRKAKLFRTGRTNMMIILYRKSYLQKLLVTNEDAWSFESNSNIRSMVAGADIIHYRINDSAPVFKYYNKFIDGVGITQRKWLDKTHEIFEMNGIMDVDYSRLGVLDSSTAYKDPTDKRTKENTSKLCFGELVYYYIKRPIKRTKIVTCIRAAICWIKYYSV